MATLTKSKITRTTGRTGRFYDIPNDDGTTARYPSVTTILGSAIAKPALIAWSAKEERTAVVAAATALYADTAQLAQRMPESAYVLALEQRLGTTKAHLKALQQAAEIGSQCHALVEWSLKRDLGQHVGPEPTVVDEALWGYMAFDDWRKAVSLQPLAIEQVVYSRTYAYAGTLDLVATLNPRALLTVLERQGAVEASLATWLTAQDTVTAVIDLKTSKSIYPESFLQTVAYQRAFAEMGHGAVDGGLILRLPKLVSDPGFEVAVAPPARELFPTFLACRTLFDWAFAQEQAYQASRKKVA